MPKFSFKVTVDNRDQVLAALPRIMKKTLEEIGDSAARHASERAPVDTGALRDSYMKDVNTGNNTVRVGSPLNYAPYVELGTGPNYTKPPGWITNNAQRGHHSVDPWWYLGDDGEWHLGWFIRSQPHLRPAFTENVSEYKEIFKNNLKNG